MSRLWTALFLLCVCWYKSSNADASQAWKNSVEARLTALEKEKPYLSMCAYKESFNEKSHTGVPFDSVFHLSTNIKEGGLSTCSGEFLFGVSGTYSVSWNSFTDRRGGGSYVSLFKTPGGTVPETRITPTMQGRTVLIDMEKGETLKLMYEGANEYGIEKLTFCISLVHVFDVKAARADKKSELKVLPKAHTTPGHTMTYNLELSGSHDDLARSVAEHFQHNTQNNSVECLENTPRKCKEVCKSYDEKQCDPGCTFDYDTLGSCKDWPYGYGTKDGQDNTINPCFFFYFQPDSFWKPEKFDGPGRPRNTPLTNDSLQLTCDAKILFEERDNYTQLQEMSEELLLLKADSLDPYVSNAIQVFLDDRKLFEEIEFSCEENVDDLGYVAYLVFIYKIDMEVEKLLSKLNPSIDQSVGENLRELLKEIIDNAQSNSQYRKQRARDMLRQSLKWRIDFGMLHETKQKIVLRNLENFVQNIDEKDDAKTLEEKLEAAVCLDKSGCDLKYNIEDFPFPRGRCWNCGIAEHQYQDMEIFLNTISLVDKLYSRDIEETLSDTISKIRKEKAWNSWEHYHRTKLSFFSDEKNAAKFVEYSKDYLLDGMYWIKEELSIRKDRKERIALTFFPESQTIPNKFFPMTGEEETPYVAIKLHLQDKEGLVPGQEILVKCRAWYAQHGLNTEPGKGMVEFKIKV